MPGHLQRVTFLVTLCGVHGGKDSNGHDEYLIYRSLGLWAVPWEKGGTADNTSRKEIHPLFTLLKLAPPFYKHHLYPIKSMQWEPLLPCLFIKLTFSLEIIYSIIIMYRIWLTGVSISTNGNFAYFVSWCVVGSPSFLFACLTKKKRLGFL